ncbi:MAG: hypothetical protein GVY08_10100 [Bacteroidetes bacterium]|jgi:hypothetical protein|nr:hypothetical protein [Bacteroidota bacterium]
MSDPSTPSRGRWKKYLLELVVVFIGVTSAFLLGNWRESRQESHLEETYLRNILSDLDADSTALAANLELFGEHLRKLERFMFSRDEAWSRDSTSTVLANSMNMIQFNGRPTTYESMKFSGHLYLVEDFELRSQIVEYYENYSTLDLAAETYSYWITQSLTPYYIQRFDMMNFDFVDPSTIEETEFKNRMFGYRVLLNQNLLLHREILKLNRGLMQALVDLNLE